MFEGLGIPREIPLDVKEHVIDPYGGKARRLGAGNVAAVYGITGATNPVPRDLAVKVHRRLVNVKKEEQMDSLPARSFENEVGKHRHLRAQAVRSDHLAVALADHEKSIPVGESDWLRFNNVFKWLELPLYDSSMELHKWLIENHGPTIPLSTILEIFEQVLLGEAQCHQHGITHGDISVVNALINAQTRETVLIDLGLSRFIGREPGINMSKAHPGLEFRAWGPELSLDPALHDGRMAQAYNDVYSSGSLLLEMLSAYIFKSHKPGISKPGADQLEAAGVPRELLDFILLMRNPDPEKRPTVVECLTKTHSLKAKYAMMLEVQV